MLRILCAGVLCGLMVTAAAAAPDEKPDTDKKGKDGFFRDPEAAFKKFDANDDGKISKDEFKEGMKDFGGGKLKEKGAAIFDKLFDMADADGDGKLSKEEFAKMLEQFRERFGDKIKEKKSGE